MRNKTRWILIFWFLGSGGKCGRQGFGDSGASRIYEKISPHYVRKKKGEFRGSEIWIVAYLQDEMMRIRNKGLWEWREKGAGWRVSWKR